MNMDSETIEGHAVQDSEKSWTFSDTFVYEKKNPSFLLK